MPKLKSFITPKGTLSQEELNNQIKELKRISDLKAQKDKSEQELRKMFNQATLKAQAKKWTEQEAKKAKILEEYNHLISFRADPLPITKISYIVNSNKEATMKIIKGDNPLNLIIPPNFRLKSLGFSEWLELGLPPLPALATFRMTAEEKKRKRTQFLKKAFVTEDIRVDGMNRNLIPPPRVVPIEGLVIKEPESGIFYMNRNTDIVFQRESEFHLTPTIQLIHIQNQIKVDSEIVDEMFRKMIYVIETYLSQRHRQGSRRLLEDILVSWDGFQLAENSISPKGATKGDLSCLYQAFTPLFQEKTLDGWRDRFDEKKVWDAIRGCGGDKAPSLDAG
ncbi:hypothetical protein Tco_0684510 [Tanacetum coccineum]